MPPKVGAFADLGITTRELTAQYLLNSTQSPAHPSLPAHKVSNT